VLAALGLLLFQVAGTPPAVTPAPSPAPTFTVLDRIAAVVGEDIILQSEIDRLAAVGFISRRAGETDADYRFRVLEERVTDLLREQQLRRIGGLEPDAAEVDARFEELVRQIEKQRGEPFEAVLAKAGATREEVRDWVRRGLALEVYARERILPRIKVTDAEMTAYYEGPFREEARAKGLTEFPPLSEVQDQVRALLRERKLNAEIDRWTEQLRKETRVVIYRR